MEQIIEVDNLIADLCLDAPNEAVKFCLRNYDYTKSISQNEKDIEKEKKRSAARYYKELENDKLSA